MAEGQWCDHCERELFGRGPWHDETCDQYQEEIALVRELPYNGEDVTAYKPEWDHRYRKGCVMSPDGVARLEGTCPECDGEAYVYPSPTDSDEGHVYCQEDDCGWVHRHLSAVSRYIETETENAGGDGR